MKKLKRLYLTCLIAVLVLGLTSQNGWAGDTVSDDIEVNGTYNTTVLQPGDVTAHNYSSSKDGAGNKIAVHYDIAVKTDPKTGVKTWDSSGTSTAKFNSNGFTTLPVKVVNATVDPVTGAVLSFDVGDTNWDSTPQNKRTLPTDTDTGFTGNVNVTNKKASLKASKSSGTAKPTLTNYIFDNTQKPQDLQVKTDPKTKQPFEVGTTIQSGQSIDYDATTKTLSIRADAIVQTPAASDPILAAAVNFPTYQFAGISPDGTFAEFWADNGGVSTITSGSTTYATSDIQVLYYDIDQNLFYGAMNNTTLSGMPPGSPFYDPNLQAISSPFFIGLDSLFNPSSPGFDPNAVLEATISPEVDFGARTNDFAQSGGAGATDVHYAADPVPEPSMLVTFVIGMMGLASARVYLGAVRRGWASRAVPRRHQSG